MENQSLSLLASERLIKLLTDSGYTLDPFSRATQLSECLGVALQLATNLLSGRVVWSLSDIALVSEAFHMTPGYFLDPDRAEPFPSDTTIVRSEDGGENIVWRAPDGFLSANPAVGAKLGYINSISPGLFFSSAPVRTKLVFEYVSGHFTASACSPSNGYVLQTPNGEFRTMSCIDVEGRTAVFSESQTKGAPVYRITDSDRDVYSAELSVVGRAIGAIQGF